jgi:hypothetical protein
MIRLSDRQIADFCHRSYHAVDGLWFMKIEERYGFDAALDLDNEVWKVLPKIQARMLKSLAENQGGLDGLSECLACKLDMEGFEFEIEGGNDGRLLRVKVSQCPWHNAMVKSGRESLSGRINSLVCNTEYSVWASEFANNISLEYGERICTGSECCVIEFRT